MTNRPDTYRLASLGTADTAKLIRLALRRAFPQLAARFFSVRSESYAGGSSVDVFWTDGPTDGEVKAAIGRYAGATFDGMIDLMSYVETALTEQDIADLLKIDRKVIDAGGSWSLRVREKKEGEHYHHEIEVPADLSTAVLLNVGDLMMWGPNFVQTHRTESPNLLAIVAERIGAEFAIYPRISFHPTSSDRPSAYFTRTEERMINGATRTLDENANEILSNTAWMGDADGAVISAHKAIEKFLGFPGFQEAPKLEVVK